MSGEKGRPVKSKVLRGGKQQLKIIFMQPEFDLSEFPDAAQVPSELESHDNRYGKLEAAPEQYEPPEIVELTPEERLKMQVDAIRGKPHDQVSDDAHYEASSKEWLRERMERTGSVLDDIDRQRKERGWADRIGGPDKRWDS